MQRISSALLNRRRIRFVIFEREFRKRVATTVSPTKWTDDRISRERLQAEFPLVRIRRVAVAASRPVSRSCPVSGPRIDHRDPALFEVSGVPGRYCGIPRPRDGGNLAIGIQNWPARGPAGSGDGGVGLGGGTVEGQHPPGEVLSDHAVDLGGEAVAPTARRQNRRAGTQLSFADGG